MKIEMNQYQENEDGSADFRVNMDKEGTQSLINFALVTLLTKAAEEGKLYNPDFYEEEEEDVNYYYDEEGDTEYYYVEDEDAWYYYDERDDEWFIVEDVWYEYDERDDEWYIVYDDEQTDDRVWVPLEPEQLDAMFVDELKKCLTKTYNNPYLFHQEDIDNSIHVRNACKTLLKHYMIRSEADDYRDGVASTYEC